MLEQPTDIVTHQLARSSIAVAGKQRSFAFPDALMHMHSRAIVSEQRLGHERSGHAALMRDVLDHIFVDHYAVGHSSERSKPHVDLTLATRRNFMVMSLNRDADGFQNCHHISAGVLEEIGRRHWEIAF